MREEQIDQRALETHAWMSGYSAGASGKEFADNPNFDQAIEEYRKGWEHGRKLFESPVKR